MFNLVLKPEPSVNNDIAVEGRIWTETTHNHGEDNRGKNIALNRYQFKHRTNVKYPYFGTSVQPGLIVAIVCRQS